MITIQWKKHSSFLSSRKLKSMGRRRFGIVSRLSITNRKENLLCLGQDIVRWDKFMKDVKIQSMVQIYQIFLRKKSLVTRNLTSSKKERKNSKITTILLWKLLNWRNYLIYTILLCLIKKLKNNNSLSNLFKSLLPI